MINQPVKEKNRIKSSAIFSRWLRGWPSKYSTWSLTADDTTGSRSDILPAALHLLRYRGNSQLCGGPDATHCPVIKDKPGPTDWLIFEGRHFYPWRAKCTQKMTQTKFHILTEKARALQIHLERKKIVRWTRCQFHRFTMKELLATINPACIRSIRSSSSHLMCTPAWINDSACQSSPSVLS